MPDTPDDYSEALSDELITRIDSETHEKKFTRRDTARIYRELASAFRDRAAGLEQEAEADSE